MYRIGMFLFATSVFFYSNFAAANFFEGFRLEYSVVDEFKQVCHDENDRDCWVLNGFTDIEIPQYLHNSDQFLLNGPSAEFQCYATYCIHNRLKGVSLFLDTEPLPEIAYGEDTFDLSGVIFFNQKKPAAEKLECTVRPIGFFHQLQHGFELYCHVHHEKQKGVLTRLRIGYIKKPIESGEEPQ